jgi:hypothetical protein
MRITEGQLRRIIREEIEASSGRAIAVVGNKKVEPVYVVAYDKQELERAVLRGPDKVIEPGDYSGVIAAVALEQDDEYGECNGAWRVFMAASNEPGWGTKVYLAAFELLRNISPDRVGVSSSAEGMWKSLVRRGFVEPEPFDDRDRPKTPPTSDDCEVFQKRDPILNASHRFVGGVPGEINDLLDAGKKHLSSLGHKRQNAETKLKIGTSNLFMNLYDT